VVFAGVFAKNGCSTWCFCGQFVVKRVDNVDSGMTRFSGGGILQRFQLYLSTGLGGEIVGIENSRHGGIGIVAWGSTKETKL
jgi:hypothetical protein